MQSYRKRNNINFNKMFELLKDHWAKNFIDLGSGDGRVVREFAKAGFESYGVEINPILVWWSRRQIEREGIGNAKITWGNFWKTNLRHFDIIFIFHFTKANKLLGQKFKKELKKDAIIISAGFPLDGFELIKKESCFLIYKNSGDV